MIICADKDEDDEKKEHNSLLGCPRDVKGCLKFDERS